MFATVKLTFHLWNVAPDGGVVACSHHDGVYWVPAFAGMTVGTPMKLGPLSAALEALGRRLVVGVEKMHDAA
jgi:hypothetical protein